jgi:hypothetical protein
VSLKINASGSTVTHKFFCDDANTAILMLFNPPLNIYYTLP